MDVKTASMDDKTATMDDKTKAMIDKSKAMILVFQGEIWFYIRGERGKARSDRDLDGM